MIVNDLQHESHPYAFVGQREGKGKEDSAALIETL